MTKLNRAVSSEWVDYPAIAVHWWSPHYFNSAYPDSVNKGKSALLKEIRAFLATDCGKSTYVYLAGYSQGAQIVGDVYQHSLSSSEKKRIAGVVLLGDPRFAAANAAVGNYDPSRFGILIDGPGHTSYGKRRIATSEKSSVRTYCQLHDPVCNYTRPDAAAGKNASSAHLHYADRTYAGLGTYTRIAAEFLIGRWRRLGPNAVSSCGDIDGFPVTAYNLSCVLARRYWHSPPAGWSGANLDVSLALIFRERDRETVMSAVRFPSNTIDAGKLHGVPLAASPVPYGE